VTNEVFFDTSVLIQGLIELGPEGHAAQTLMSKVASGKLRRPSTAWHCCLEFFSVTTRLPEEFRLSPEQARDLVEEEILGRFKIFELPEPLRKTFFHDAVRDRAAGGRVYDAHIAAIARAGRARVVVTENVRHFAALERDGVRVLSASDFVEKG
jgi:predicted nucleic acid-binding protein